MANHVWEGLCKWCQKSFRLDGRRARNAKKRGFAFCNPTCSGKGTPTPNNVQQEWVGNCNWCKSPIRLKGRAAVAPRKRGYGYCGGECARLGKNAGIGKANAVSILKIGGLIAARMRANNPSKRPEVKAKISASMKGRTFLARGGNGKPTAPQLRLAEALGWPIEVAIKTSSVANLFTSLPHSYKVDIGNETLQIAVEVDGPSHKTKRWKFLDRRKEEVLRALGWTVLRFWNQDVMGRLEECVQTVLSTTWKWKKPTPTSLRVS